MQKQSLNHARSSEGPALMAGAAMAGAAFGSDRFGADNQWSQDRMASAVGAHASMAEGEGGILGAFAMDGARAGAAGADPARAGAPDPNAWMIDFGRGASVPRGEGTSFDDDSDLTYKEDDKWRVGPGERKFTRKDLKDLIDRALEDASDRSAAKKKAAERKQKLKDASEYMSDSELDDLRDQWAFDDLLDEQDAKSKGKRDAPRSGGEGDSDAEEKDTYKKQLERLGITKESFSFGSFRDESDIDVTEFMSDRSEANFVGSASGSVTWQEVADDGTVHSTTKHQARAGASVGGYDAHTFIDGKAVTEGAVSGNIAADAVVDATSGTYDLEDGSGARADVSGRAGVSGTGAGAIQRTVDLGGRVSGNTEAGGSVDGFIGVEADAGAQAEARSGKALVRAGAQGSAGATIAGEGAAQANLNAGKTRIVGARVQAEGEAFAGVKAGVDTVAEACIKNGVKVEAGGDAMAGATAKGEASGGVTLGGVDADVVAEGEAFAGAKAGAKGAVEFGPKGGELTVGAEAFAGATAEGSVGAVFGAAGLSLAQVQVTGKVKAGAGGKFDFNVKAQDGEVSGKLEAAGAVGVGAGMGLKVQGDVLFVPRLILDQVVKNGPAVAADNGSANMGGCGWVVRPAAGSPDSAEAGAVVEEKPLAQLLDELDLEAAEPFIEHRELGDGAIEGAYETVGETANQALSAGLTLFGRIGPAIGAKFVEAEGAHAEAWQAIEELTAAAGSHAGTIFGKLGQVGGLALAELGALLTTPIWQLLDRDFEEEVEAVLSRVEALILQVRALIVEVIEATRDAVLDVGAKAGRAILLPIRNVANTAGAVVGEMGMEFVGAGLDITEALTDGFTPAEEGIEVEGTGAEIFLPHAVTPGLAPGERVLNDGKGFFDGATAGSFGVVIQKIAEPILTSVLVEAPLKLIGWAQSLLATFDATFAAVWQPIQSVVRSVAFFLAPAVNGLRAFLRSIGLGVSRPERAASAPAAAAVPDAAGGVGAMSGLSAADSGAVAARPAVDTGAMSALGSVEAGAVGASASGGAASAGAVAKARAPAR